MAKKYRRFIKFNGQLIGSPEYDTAKEANDWYQEQKTRRDKIKKGKRSGQADTFMEWTAKWTKRLIADYDKPTWGGYESNLRLHLLPYLKDYRMDEITRAKCREVLMNVTRNGFSVNHRKHVQATLSKIFTDAMNDEPPQRDDNPVYRMKFDGKRQTQKYIPNTLEEETEIAELLKKAKEKSDMHFVLACLGLMAALRKSEMIALRWGDIRWAKNEIRVRARYRQAMNRIDEGTKSGEDTYRDVPVAPTLIEVLKTYRERTKFSASTDFVLCQPDGSHWRSRSFHDRFVEIRELAERPDLTLHSLRHTYGRFFALKTGNTKALQRILGHSSPATTAIYSELSSTQVKPLAEKMSFTISDTDDTDDTKTTQKKI